MRVAIIGIGMTRFGQHWNRSLSDLAVEAGARALEDAGISSKDVDALYGGSMSSGLFTGQEHIASLLAEEAGFTPKPSVRVEAACASGALALRQGILAVKSGMHDTVMVGGVEKMTDLSTQDVTQVLATASSQEWEVAQGATFPALYAMLARAHMEKFGTTREQLASVAVKNHLNATKNVNAQFRKAISVQDVLDSQPVADPLTLLDCAPITDGAAALIICSEEKARSLSERPIWIAGTGHATDSISLHDRASLLEIRASVKAAKQAYEQSGLRPQDIDVAEVHDCFTIAELFAIEDLGFVPKGSAGKFTLDGQSAIGGKLPINTSGGLKAKGHPVGASGVAQAVEAVLQLRGEAGERQVQAENALIHSVGGSGGSALVHVLQK